MKKMYNNRETEGAGFHSFHSSRKERYAAGHIKEPPDKKGFFQRNPSFKILLIDLIFIAIISGVIVPFIFKREGVATVNDYSIKLRAFYYDEDIMASLTVEAEDTEETGNGYVEAFFYTEKSKQEVKVEDLLPVSGGERLLKAVLAHDGEDYLLCRVEISGISKTLRKKIK
jgi:hypothetical protein